MASYKFLDEIPIHVDFTLVQLLGRFQTVVDGLPELLKNGKDQYSRLGVMAPQDRVILVLADSADQSLAVVDFGGASAEDFRRWQTWSDPTANKANLSADIEGGHGNGGKGFMVRGSTQDSFLDSVFNGRRTKMGFKNDEEGKRFFPAYFVEGGRPVDNVVMTRPEEALESALAFFGVTLSKLPPSVQESFRKRGSFTFAQVNGVKDWDGRRRDAIKRAVDAIPERLRSHAQASLTLETCTVVVAIDGKVVSTGLKAEYPAPYPGFEELQPIPLPRELKDPRTGEVVIVNEKSDLSVRLQLRTSERSLRMPETRALITGSSNCLTEHQAA
jgi:hypothetical protein